MLKKRIIVCLDVKDGRTTKGVKFQNNVDIGDPVEMAKKYYEQGVDELVFYDIMASARGRGPILDLISRVAEQVFIPFCVGGGIGSIEDIRSTILAGAEKVSLNSQAVKNPGLKVPQIGWNDLNFANGGSKLLEGVPEHSDFYFVHSYLIQPEDKTIVKAWVDYGTQVPACVESENITVFQCHPEKSGKCGLQVLKNFING